MALHLSTREVEGVAIVDAAGELRLGEGTGKLREVIRQLTAEGYRKVLLNLSGIQHVDSSGMGELMSNYTSLRNLGGELKISNLSKNVRNLLQITRLLTILDVHETQESALQAFR